MKPVRVKLYYPLELVAGLALGFTAVRAAMRHANFPSILVASNSLGGSYVNLATLQPLDYWYARFSRTEWQFILTIYINPVLNALVFVEFLMILAERARRARPKPFGLGRWTWAFAGSYLVIQAATYIGSEVAPQSRISMALGIPMRWDSLLARFVLGGVGVDFPLTLLAAWVGLWIGLRPTDPEPDAREWAGRVFGGGIILWGLALKLLEFFF